ncbi:MAG: ATP-binding protein, partial [Lachnospiraceae bacterium]|nr:ATP-binding protein [Lachnospiraceae bacterium]
MQKKKAKFNLSIKIPSMESLTQTKLFDSLGQKSRNLKRSEEENSIKKQEKKEEGFTQDFIGVKSITGGLAIMDSGDVIAVMEVIPMNFNQRDVLERNMISESFKEVFRIAPQKLHFKIRTEKTDVTKLMQNLNQINADETDPKILAQIENYKEYIRELQKSNVMCKRFYVIFAYDRDSDGSKSSDINEIYRSMVETGSSIATIFESMGNRVIHCFNDNKLMGEMLYHLLNPNTSYIESFDDRLSRIHRDTALYNLSVDPSQKKSCMDCDFLAPKGIRIYNNHVLSDGIYFTFLCLKDNGFPSRVNAGWLNVLSMREEDVDIDVITKRKNRDLAKSVLSKMNRIDGIRLQDSIHNKEKYKRLSNKIQNVTSIVDHLERLDDDLFDVMIIITIRGTSLKETQNKRNRIKKLLHSKSLYTEDSFLTAHDYFKMTLPFMYINNSIFSKNARNVVTTSMSSLYCFTAYALFDVSGFVIGYNMDNNTMVAINNFNTKLYSNANVLILGKSGSGKTFLEMMLGYRMRMMGMKVIYILPIKGFEFKHACHNMNGLYLQHYPGSDLCINMMQIRPESNIDQSVFDEMNKVVEVPLLAKKCASIEREIQSLMGNDTITSTESGNLNKALVAIFNRYGITDDNDSIWADKKNKIVKQMPVVQHLADYIAHDRELSRIYSALTKITDGSCQNLNGQTNVSFDNNYIVFDVNKDTMTEKELPFFMQTAFECSYDLAKQNLFEKVVIFLDEAWLLMISPEMAAQVSAMVKVIRGYGGSVIISSQDIEDFMKRSNGFGASVLNSTELKFFLAMKEQEIKLLASEMDFTQEDIKHMKQYPKGSGMIYANGDKVAARFKASPKEEELFTTDINVRQQ